MFKWLLLEMHPGSLLKVKYLIEIKKTKKKQPHKAIIYFRTKVALQFYFTSFALVWQGTTVGCKPRYFQYQCKTKTCK